jgi:hypothetical protein
MIGPSEMSRARQGLREAGTMRRFKMTVDIAAIRLSWQLEAEI